MPAHTDPGVKHDALLLFEAIDSNPNGDPDNSGRPRVDLDNGRGLVSDASLKRKIRDSVQFQVDQGLVSTEGNAIFIQRGVALNDELEKAYDELGLAKGKPDAAAIRGSQEYMISRYFDVRMFGAVMSTGKASAGKVTGPVTVGIGRTLDPVIPIDFGITRTASTRTEDKDNASQMGNKTVIPYGLYAVRIHYQPTRNNQVTEADLSLLWTSIIHMFELTRSAARPDIGVRGLYVFTHENALGSAPARLLIDSVRIEKQPEIEIPSAPEHYTITDPDPSALPAGVTLTRLV